MCGRVYSVYVCCVKYLFLAPFFSVAYVSLNNTYTSSVSQPSKGSRPRGGSSQWMFSVSVGLRATLSVSVRFKLDLGCNYWVSGSFGLFRY